MGWDAGARSLVRWQHAAGAFWPYVAATPFLSGGEPAGGARGARPLSRTPAGMPRALLEERGVATFFDLPPVQGLRLAPLLNNRGLVAVPIIQRWCAPGAVLPATALLQALVRCAELVRRQSAPRGVVFVLDGERDGGRHRNDPAPLRRFDNRYRYPQHSFPPAAFLREQGIETVRLVSIGDMAEDLREYLAGLEAEGLHRVS